MNLKTNDESRSTLHYPPTVASIKSTSSNKLGKTTKKERDIINILNAGIAAAAPKTILDKILKNQTIKINHKRIVSHPKRHNKTVRIISFGKAGLSMAMAFDKKIKAKDGIVVIPRGIRYAKNSKFKIMVSDHPTPTQKSVLAAKAIISYIQKCDVCNDLIIFLVSGGASSLVALPPDGVTLDEKIKTNEVLLQTNASIAEINCVRKHVSSIKGGQIIHKTLLQKIASTVAADATSHSYATFKTNTTSTTAISLLMSDVKANDMTVIASGITYCDKTTFVQALKIIKKYKIYEQIPKNVIRHIRLGAQGKIPETPKKPIIPNYVIASNKNCIIAMQKRARMLKYNTRITTTFGKIEKQSKILAKMVQQMPNKSCIIFGGETTTKIRGSGGLGGRNQEMVLRLASQIKRPIVSIGCIGTDGIDGNTKFAGAILTDTSKTSKTEIAKYLQSSNSCNYFKKIGGDNIQNGGGCYGILVKTGPTQTNLLDIGVILRYD